MAVPCYRTLLLRSLKPKPALNPKGVSDSAEEMGAESADLDLGFEVELVLAASDTMGKAPAQF